MLLLLCVSFTTLDLFATAAKVIASWPLNEGHGTVVKNIYGDNNGIFEMNAGNKKLSWNGKELTFPGDAGDGSIRIMKGRKLLTGPYFTISIDVKRGEKLHEGVIYGNKAQIQKEGGFFLKHSGAHNRFHVNFADGTAVYNMETKYAMPLNEWVNIKVIYDGVNLKINVDGTTVGSINVPGVTLTAGPKDLRIGGYYNPKMSWQGSLRNFNLSVPNNDVTLVDEKSGIYKVDIAKEQPVIDGDLDDSIWEKATFHSNFARFYKGKNVENDTEFALAADNKNLYIAVKCFISDPEKMVLGKNRERDGHTFSDDSIELFIDPDKSNNHYFHLVLNAGNKYYDSVVTYFGKKKRPDFNLKMKSATKVFNDYWIAEIAIPYTELAVKPDNYGLWHFNIGRNDCTVDEKHKYSSWGKLEQEEKCLGFHDFNLFQIFAGFPKPQYKLAEQEKLNKVRKQWDLDVIPSTNPIAMIAVHDTMMVANNMVLPNWFKCRALAPEFMNFNTVFNLDLPKGVKLIKLNGLFSGVWNITESKVKHNGKNYTRYRIKPVSLHPELRVIGSIFMTSTLENDTSVPAYYFAEYDGGKQAIQKLNILIKTMPKPGMPRKLHSSIGWFFAEDWMNWPGFLNDYAALGFNAFGSHQWYDRKIPFNDIVAVFNKAKIKGMKIMSIQSPFASLSTHPEAKSIKLSGETDENPNDICPAYRGKYYQQELTKIGQNAELVEADYVIFDVECYHDGSFAGKSKSCLNCKKWIEKSGKDPADAITDLGTQIAVDAKEAVTKALTKIGKKSAEVGFYHTLPGGFVYQDTFDFDKMHKAGGANFSMPVVYNSSKAMEAGNKMRRMKKLQPNGEIISWFTTGFLDLGGILVEYPTPWVYDYVLEGYANGTRGISWFAFSGFETSDFYYFAKAMESILPVEDLIYHSSQLKGVKSSHQDIKVYAISHGEDILLLLTEYKNGTSAKVTITLPRVASGMLFDLAEKKELGAINGKEITIDFKPGVKGAHTALYWITNKPL